MGTTIIIVILCFLSSISISVVNGGTRSECSPGLNTAGITVPQGGIAVLYGQPLELYCVLDTEHVYYTEMGYNSSMLMFQRGKDLIEPEYVSVINSTTIRLFIPHPAISESMYYCKLRNENEEAVCYNQVTVGTEPQEVDNFDCYSLNWNNLTCKWTPPHNYLLTHYMLNFRLPRRSGRVLTFACPNMTKETETGEYSCFWDMSTSPQYKQSYPTYTFNLTSYNKFGSRSQDIVFNHYGHVKPNPPGNLTVSNKTPHSCQLHWTLPDPMKNFPPGVIHRIIYRTDLKNDWYTVNTSGLAISSRAYYYNLTDLPYAYMFYDVRVFIRSERAVMEKYWSDYAGIVFRTLGKPPERSPPVDIGSFEVVTNLHHRNVTVYWEQFEKYEENGDNFTYIVEVLIDGIKVNYLTTQSRKGYAIIRSLPLKTLQFLISASNAEGDSPTKSSLIVPTQTELLAEPSYFTKAALGNGTYELTWKAPKTDPSRLSSYTVFWCDNSRDRPFQCEGRLHWERVPANMTTRNFTVPDDRIYQFAISANGHNTSSGMVWAFCTVLPDKAVGKIKEIWIHKQQATYLEIKWKLECPENVGAGYRISCCPIYGLQNTSCRDAEKTITVMSNDNVGILRGLKPWTTYVIQVAIIAKHEVGPQSDPILATTLEAAPDPPRNVSISGLTSSRMLVSWQPPLITNGKLQYYMIYYRAHGSSWSEVKVEIENGFTEKELTGLRSFTNYTVHVKAFTVSFSVASEELLVRTAIGAPGRISRPPVITNYLTEHKVEWLPPEFAGGTLDLYEVSRIKMRQDGNETQILNTTDTYLNIADRICQEEGVLSYLYSVRAINFDSAEDHGAAAFTHLDRVSITRRPPDDYNKVIFPGPWSPHVENTCTLAYQANNTTYWVIGVLAIFFLIVILLCIKKAWVVIDKMRSIKPIMPDGLFPESEKDSKYPLGNWNPPPKHDKEHDVQYPSAPADEVSLLGSPSLAPVSPGGPVLTSGGSLRRTNSPVWPASAPYCAVGAWPTDESDAEVPPAPSENPYVSFATEPNSISALGGYVQAAMLPAITKESPTSTVIPSNYCMRAPDIPPTPVEQPQSNVLPSSYVRTAVDPTSAPTPRVAVVSPYVTVDDVRFAPAPSPAPPPETKKEIVSGYVTHDHSMFNNPKTELPVLEHTSLPKRVSAPPLFNTKLNSDSNKRISLSNYTTVGLDTPDPACSPEYCRFGWNSSEGMRVDQLPGVSQEDTPPPINMANLDKEEYELPLENLLSDETSEIPSKPATASHYLPLNLHTLKS